VLAGRGDHVSAFVLDLDPLAECRYDRAAGVEQVEVFAAAAGSGPQGQDRGVDPLEDGEGAIPLVPGSTSTVSSPLAAPVRTPMPASGCWVHQAVIFSGLVVAS